jgi:hypothetical protein
MDLSLEDDEFTTVLSTVADWQSRLGSMSVNEGIAPDVRAACRDLCDQYGVMSADLQGLDNASEKIENGSMAQMEKLNQLVAEGLFNKQ